MDKRCDGCQYDLRGSPIRGRCPECGHPFDKVSGLGISRPVSTYERGDRLMLTVSAFGCLGAMAMLFGGAGWVYLIGRQRAAGLLLFLTLLLLLPTINQLLKWRKAKGRS